MENEVQAEVVEEEEVGYQTPELAGEVSQADCSRRLERPDLIVMNNLMEVEVQVKGRDQVQMHSNRGEDADGRVRFRHDWHRAIPLFELLCHCAAPGRNGYHRTGRNAAGRRVVALSRSRRPTRPEPCELDEVWVQENRAVGDTTAAAEATLSDAAAEDCCRRWTRQQGPAARSFGLPPAGGRPSSVAIAASAISAPPGHESRRSDGSSAGVRPAGAARIAHGRFEPLPRQPPLSKADLLGSELPEEVHVPAGSSTVLGCE